MDWTGGITEEELFSGSDRWHQEKVMGVDKGGY